MRVKRTNLIGTLPDRLESRSYSGYRDLAPDIWCPGCTDLWMVRAPSRALLGPLLRHTRDNYTRRPFFSRFLFGSIAEI